MNPFSSILENNSQLDVCMALAAIGRTRAALLIAAAAAENSSDPGERNIYLAALARVSGMRVPLDEAASNRAVFGCARPVIDMPPPELKTALSEFEAAGLFVHPLSYSAAMAGEQTQAKELAYLGFPPHLLLRAVSSGGPITALASAFSTIATDWHAKHTKSEKAGPPDNQMQDTSTGALFQSRRTSAEAAAHFLLRSPRCLTSALRAIEAIDRAQAHSKLWGASEYERSSLAMLGALSACETTSLEDLETVITSLAESKREIYTCPTLRQVMFFSSCGHVYRLLARNRAQAAQIDFRSQDSTSVPARHISANALLYNREDVLECARKYILAAATSPLDDPELPHRYEQVIWSLLLAGGLQLSALWPFLVMRARAEVELFSAPMSVPPSSPHPPWPCYVQGAEILSRVFDLCLLSRGDQKALSPTFIEARDSVYVADNFYPTVSHFVNREGYAVFPALRPKILLRKKLAHESKAIVHLWTSVYYENHGPVPEETQWS
ncbi:hypothetical protein FOB63_002276 [Clavispora lusitaniae]|uniref:uncharacterized protein n=1 Tax=Clavispora lusitaniae TaxID=36911 RepID=UPI00202BF3DD|nr:hypothetical protein FOB63_002276 [Clavispora lusitaniae]